MIVHKEKENLLQLRDLSLLLRTIDSMYLSDDG